MSQGALFPREVWIVTQDRPGGRMRTGIRDRDVVVQLLKADGTPAGGVLVLRPVEARAWAAALTTCATRAQGGGQ